MLNAVCAASLVVAGPAGILARFGVSKLETPRPLGRLVVIICSGQGDVGQGIHSRAAIVGEMAVAARESALLGSGDVIMSMAVPVFVIMIVVLAVGVLAGSVGVAVAAQDEKAHQVGGQTSAADNQNQLGVLDGGRIEEALGSVKDDGDTEGDKEDGVEEGAEDFGAQPLFDSQSGPLPQAATGRSRRVKGK